MMSTSMLHMTHTQDYWYRELCVIAIGTGFIYLSIAYNQGEDSFSDIDINIYSIKEL